MKKSFEIKIPSIKVQKSWDNLDAVVSDKLQAMRTEMDGFIDDETTNMSEIMRAFAGKKVRFTIETI